MCWRRCKKLPCKTLVLVIKSFHLRRFPSEYRLSSDHRLRLAEHEVSASDSTRPYSPSLRPSSEPLHDRGGTDDLGTGSCQTPSPDNPSRSSSQSVSTPTQERQHRTSSGKRIVSILVESHRRKTGCFTPH